ncbi:hypothetical protein IHV25_07990 [Phaeovibrio sulfidiphilus]|uniref:Uncharacterized protein n=1 Tax=Phaeovibrio sulfidiphilus TaxID=1220600 RepID=A0A8J6YXP3_9PROT|nr:hypothetical protein [Phaeovibrio sulfidiphilus]MBE1237587.1 hypothetical protein [Phaeovibrio sulfidiphilus]
MAKQETPSPRRSALRRKDASASERSPGRLSATRTSGAPDAEDTAAGSREAPAAAAAPSRAASGTRSGASSLRASRSDAQPMRRSRDAASPSASRAAGAAPASERAGSRTPARPRNASGSGAATPAAGKGGAAPLVSRTDKPGIRPLPPTPVARPAFDRRLPGSVDVHVEDLLKSLARLYDVLVQENEALARMDVRTAQSCLEEKERATLDYRRNLLAVHRNPGLLLNLEEDQKAAMRRAGEALKTVSEENCRRLQAGMDAIGYTIESVFQAVREYVVEHTASYTEEGTVEPNFTSSSDKSISVNRTL